MLLYKNPNNNQTGYLLGDPNLRVASKLTFLDPVGNLPSPEVGNEADFQLLTVIVFATNLFVSIIGDLGKEIEKAVLPSPDTSKLVE